MALQAPKPKKQDPGAPAWLATFADLMSLLLCFFVLLLTFSEIDAAKFKETSGSLKMAFGVQRDERFDQVPMGTSLVAQEYSPGQQQLMDFDILGEAFKGAGDSNMSKREQLLYEQDMKASKAQIMEVLKKSFAQEISNKEMVIETLPDHKIILRVPSDLIFEESTAQMKREYAATLIKIARVTKDYAAHTAVLAHASKKPLNSRSFRSKWDFTATRAGVFTDALISVGENEPSKFLVMSHADTRPVNPKALKEAWSYESRIEVILLPNPNIQ